MTRSQPFPIGILLAAGRGRRMGRTKQLVSWPTEEGEKPLVAAAFDAIAGVCREMIVVVGHQADAVTAALENRSFHSVPSDPDAPMYESVRAGLREAQRCCAAAHALLQPADQPAIRRDTLDALFRSAADHPDRAVFPTHRGKGGHPVLIPATRIAQLLEYDGTNGLRAFWERNPEKRIRIPVDDPAVIQNVNTPADVELPP